MVAGQLRLINCRVTIDLDILRRIWFVVERARGWSIMSVQGIP